MEFEGNSRTMHNQVGSKGRQRRQHHVEECRNIICAHMKRGDPATNRFIDYCIMQGGNLLIAVRDGVTGQVVTAPDKDQDERWIHRSKSGLGRASKNEWEVLKEINREFFDYVDFQREWHFDFDSHYEVYIWDFFPGEKPLDLIHRLTDVSQNYHPLSPTLLVCLTKLTSAQVTAASPQDLRPSGNLRPPATRPRKYYTGPGDQACPSDQARRTGRKHLRNLDRSGFPFQRHDDQRQTPRYISGRHR